MNKINFFYVSVLILLATGCSDFSVKETFFDGEVMVEYTGGWYLGAQDELNFSFYKEGFYKISFSGRKGYVYPEDTFVLITYPKAIVLKDVRPEFELTITDGNGKSETKKLP